MKLQRGQRGHRRELTRTRAALSAPGCCAQCLCSIPAGNRLPLSRSRWPGILLVLGAAAIELVTALGERTTGERHDYEEGAVVVMADPDGHEFCLVQY